VWSHEVEEARTCKPQATRSRRVTPLPQCNVGKGWHLSLLRLRHRLRRLAVAPLC
jgi:hypothetical protein